MGLLRWLLPGNLPYSDTCNRLGILPSNEFNLLRASCRGPIQALHQRVAFSEYESLPEVVDLYTQRSLLLTHIGGADKS